MASTASLHDTYYSPRSISAGGSKLDAFKSNYLLVFNNSIHILAKAN